MRIRPVGGQPPSYPATRRRREAFTLIEVLLVLVILVILASLVGISVRSAQKRALVDAARAQIGQLKTNIAAYQLDIRRYPTSAQGLAALITAPSDLPNPDRWRGPYMEAKEPPLDPWDAPYRYELVDEDNYRIWSVGPDGSDGTEDDVSSAEA